MDPKENPFELRAPQITEVTVGERQRIESSADVVGGLVWRRGGEGRQLDARGDASDPAEGTHHRSIRAGSLFRENTATQVAL